MMRHGLFLLLTLAVISRVASDNVLVVVDDPFIRSKHSQYFSDLIGRGHNVDIRSVNDKNLKLRDWDEWLYDKLVIFAPRADGFGGELGAPAVLEFVDAGNDVVIAADTQASDFIRNLVADIGVDLELRGTAVTDHVNFAKSSTADHTLIVSDKFVKSDAILGNFTQQAPILFKGVAATISPQSTLGLLILSAPDTAFSHVPGKAVSEHPLVANGHAALVSAIQARSGARVLVSGSLDMFSNAFFSSAVETNSGKRFAQSGNRLFCDEITKWVFHERGVLRVTNLHHNHAGSEEQPHWYRVSDDLEFGMDIHELAGGTWQPYRASDVQLEFVMLDPYWRLNLQHDDQGHYFTSFKVPDVYGIYKFVVSYHQTGYNPLERSKTVSVRPFRHNEFERFLTAAYPYYMSVFSTMAAFFLFGFVFLYHK